MRYLLNILTVLLTFCALTCMRRGDLFPFHKYFREIACVVQPAQKGDVDDLQISVCKQFFCPFNAQIVFPVGQRHVSGLLENMAQIILAHVHRRWDFIEGYIPFHPLFDDLLDSRHDRHILGIIDTGIADELHRRIDGVVSFIAIFFARDGCGSAPSQTRLQANRQKRVTSCVFCFELFCGTFSKTVD